MNASMISENLLKAIELTTEKMISNLSFDKTINCTIVEVKDEKQGIYLVSDGSSQFTAIGLNNTYIKDEAVYVLIPQGDYSQQKTIIGKRINESQEINYRSSYDSVVPIYEYIQNLDSLPLIDLNDQYLQDLEEKDLYTREIKLTANDENLSSLLVFSVPKQQFTGCTRLGLQANLTTGFSEDKIITEGDYGLIARITGQNNSTNKIETKGFIFSSSSFFGNPYLNSTENIQSISFDISMFKEIEAIDILFYQNNDFQQIDEDTGEIIRLDVENESNLFLSNLKISLGVDINTYKNNDLVLFDTSESLDYSILDNTNNKQKTLSLVAMRETLSNILLSNNSMEDLISTKEEDDEVIAFTVNAVEEILPEDEELPEDSITEILPEDEEIENVISVDKYPYFKLLYENELINFHWYKYKLDDSIGFNTVINDYYWEEQSSNIDSFQFSFTPAAVGRERIKAALVSNGQLTLDEFTYAEDGTPNINTTSYSILDEVDWEVIKKSLINEVDQSGGKYKAQEDNFPNEDTTKIYLYRILENVAENPRIIKEFYIKKQNEIEKIISNEIVYTNTTNEDSIKTVNLVKNLSLDCLDTENGYYYIYGLDNTISASAAAQTRTLKASVEITSVLGLDIENAIIQWFIPKENSMIEIPQNTGDRIWTEFIDTANKKWYTITETLNNTASGSTDQLIRAEALINYTIKNTYYSANNNTIKCIVKMNNIENVAEKTLYFGPSGTSGTKYTFTLSLGDRYDNKIEDDKNVPDLETKYAKLPFLNIDDTYWTKIQAELYDSNRNLVTLNNNITWIWKPPSLKKWINIQKIFGEDITIISKEVEYEYFEIYNPPNNEYYVRFKQEGNLKTEIKNEISQENTSNNKVKCSINEEVFTRQFEENYNTYEFIYSSSENEERYWKLDDQQIELSDYGIDYTLLDEEIQLIDGDKITINYIGYRLNDTNDSVVAIDLALYISANPLSASLSVDNEYILTSYLPIAAIGQNSHVNSYEGAVQIIYDQYGSNAVYYKLEHKLYDTNNQVMNNLEWTIYVDGILATINEETVNNYPVFGYGNNTLQVPALYFSNYYNQKSISIVVKQEDVIIFVQPLLITQNAYENSLLNEWDKKLTIDTEEGTILSTVLGAGSKNTDNKFSGVLMGDFKPDGVDIETGLFGFDQGVQSFGFKTDGTAFLGSAGSGRIEFNGNSGIIKSADYKDTGDLALSSGSSWNLQTSAFKLYGDSSSETTKILLDTKGDNSNQDYLALYAVLDNNEENELNILDLNESKTLVPLLACRKGENKQPGEFFLQSLNYFNIQESIEKEYDELSGSADTTGWLKIDMNRGIAYIEQGLLGSWFVSRDKFSASKVFYQEDENDNYASTLLNLYTGSSKKISSDTTIAISSNDQKSDSKPAPLSYDWPKTFNSKDAIEKIETEEIIELKFTAFKYSDFKNASTFKSYYFPEINEFVTAIPEIDQNNNYIKVIIDKTHISYKYYEIYILSDEWSFDCNFNFTLTYDLYHSEGFIEKIQEEFQLTTQTLAVLQLIWKTYFVYTPVIEDILSSGYLMYETPFFEGKTNILNQDIEGFKIYRNGSFKIDLGHSYESQLYSVITQEEETLIPEAGITINFIGTKDAYGDVIFSENSHNLIRGTMNDSIIDHEIGLSSDQEAFYNIKIMKSDKTDVAKWTFLSNGSIVFSSGSIGNSNGTKTIMYINDSQGTGLGLGYYSSSVMSLYPYGEANSGILYNLGVADRRWANIYSTQGDFSSLVEINSSGASLGDIGFNVKNDEYSIRFGIDIGKINRGIYDMAGSNNKGLNTWMVAYDKNNYLCLNGNNYVLPGAPDAYKAGTLSLGSSTFRWNGIFGVDGDFSGGISSGTLHLTSTADADWDKDTNMGALQIGTLSGEHMRFDTNEIICMANKNTRSTLYIQALNTIVRGNLYPSTGDETLGTSDNRWATVYGKKFKGGLYKVDSNLVGKARDYATFSIPTAPGGYGLYSYASFPGSYKKNNVASSFDIQIDGIESNSIDRFIIRYTRGNEYSSGTTSSTGLAIQVRNDNSANEVFRPLSHKTMALGTSSNQWGSIHGTNYYKDGVGFTSDKRLKTIQSYEILEKDLMVYNLLTPIVYKYKNFNISDDYSRTHIGFFAQDVEQLIRQVGLSSEDCALIQALPVDDNLDIFTDGKKYYLNYNELHGLHVLKNHQQDTEIASLKEEIKQLKQKISKLESIKS